ncbi:MAG TPA: DUF222 domain-containing protein [Acidimicrobiales bacterium]|jgi:hypothetical protein|nr:DUF222 domain-containing protein [Acidimicrobiales bacterium]
MRLFDDEVRLSAEVGVEAAALPRERLEAELCLLAAHDTSLMYRRLVMLAEFERRELAGSWGMASTAAWLSWQTGLDTRTAREQVRVARRLPSLSLVSEAMARGLLSYSKVRALTRFATAAAEAELVELAAHTTAAQLETIARITTRGLSAELGGAGDGREPESIITSYPGDAGMSVIYARLPSDDAAMVMAWLDGLIRQAGAAGGGGSAEPPSVEDAAPGEDVAPVPGAVAPCLKDVDDGAVAGVDVDSDLEDEDEDDVQWRGEPGDPVLVGGVWVYPDDDEHDAGGDVGVGGSAGPDGEASVPPVAVCAEGRPSVAHQRAEVFVDAVDALMSGSDACGCGGGAAGVQVNDRFLINVIADLSVFDGTATSAGGQLNLIDDGSAISSDVVRRLACNEPLALVVKDREGNPLYMGRKIRLANRRQRRAALARSKGMCGFPMCERRARLQVHHTDPWAPGGRTDIDQLVPLCRFHHRCVHHDGFEVRPVPGGFAFFTPDGREIVETPEPAAGQLSLEQIREMLRRPLRRSPESSSPWGGDGERLDLDLTMSGVFSVLARAS